MRYLATCFLSLTLLIACGQGGKNEQDNPAAQTTEPESDTLKVSLEKVWETEQGKLSTPECATFNPDKNIFYVSNLNLDNEVENDGYIALVNADGSIENEKWVEGLKSPLGNDFYNGHLYVNDGTSIVKIELESGSITERIPVEGAAKLNGMDIDPDGTIYAADSDGNKIFKVTQDGEVTMIAEGAKLNKPNGVFINGDELVIASMSGNSLISLNLETEEITSMVEEIKDVDGILPLDNGSFITSSWSGVIHFISNDMEKQVILDTTKDSINAADIGYIPEQNLLVVPTFFDNRLVAYKVSYN